MSEDNEWENETTADLRVIFKLKKSQILLTDILKLQDNEPRV